MSTLAQITPLVNAEFWFGFQLYADSQPADACATDAQRQGWQYGLRCEAAYYGVRPEVLTGEVTR